MALLKNPECFGIHFWLSMIILGFVVCGFCLSELRADALVGKPVTILRLYTMDNCPHCVKLESYLQKHGVDIRPDLYTDQTYEAVNGYPTVVYTDGSSDHGAKILKRKVFLPENPITVIHYKEGR